MSKERKLDDADLEKISGAGDKNLHPAEEGGGGTPSDGGDGSKTPTGAGDPTTGMDSDSQGSGNATPGQG